MWALRLIIVMLFALHIAPNTMHQYQRRECKPILNKREQLDSEQIPHNHPINICAGVPRAVVKTLSSSSPGIVEIESRLSFKGEDWDQMKMRLSQDLDHQRLNFK